MAPLDNALKSAGLLRDHDVDRQSKVGYIELFFDLVFVFSFTQLSHYLIDHNDVSGILQTLIMFLAIWWAWMYTTWATNWANIDRGPVRAMVIVLMLLSMVISVAIPTAFTDGRLVFAVGYVVLQLGRTAFMIAIMRRADHGGAANMLRVGVYFLLAAPLWIGGALTDNGYTQMALWAAALAIEYSGPAVHFYLPGRGRSDVADWSVAGEHMAERCALLIIIALGEGIIITGAAFAELTPTGPTIAAFLIAFAGSAALWWVYFDVGAVRGAKHIEDHANPGAVARLVYTYLHIPIVAGIIVLAVADEMLLGHPTGASEPLFIAALALGAGLFLAGTMVFKWVSWRRRYPPPSHSAGLLLVGAVAVWGWLAAPTPLLVGAATVAILIIVAVWEWASVRE